VAILELEDQHRRILFLSLSLCQLQLKQVGLDHPYRGLNLLTFALVVPNAKLVTPLALKVSQVICSLASYRQFSWKRFFLQGLMD